MWIKSSNELIYVFSFEYVGKFEWHINTLWHTNEMMIKK